MQDGDQLDQLLQSIHGCLLLQSVCMCMSVEREDKGGRERERDVKMILVVYIILKFPSELCLLTRIKVMKMKNCLPGCQQPRYSPTN